MDLPTRLECTGCGRVVPAREPYPFRCAHADREDDIDHVLTRIVDPGFLDDPGITAVFLDEERNPFIRYRKLFHSYHAALDRGLADPAYVDLVHELDAAVAGVDGIGFVSTPFLPEKALGQALGLDREDGLWVKDETGNVSGTHKARHLMGILLWLEMLHRTGERAPAGISPPKLAISSCGNAALAAGIVARAARRPLEVFVPPHAPPAVLERLEELGAMIATCPRDGETPGDPCYLRFQDAVAGGALPFTVQGNHNVLTLEGGATLGYEMVSEIVREGCELDRLFLQVGGGALASATIRAFREARVWGLLPRLPRIHAVQTEGAWPLARAYDRLADRIVARVSRETGAAPPVSEAPWERARWIEENAAPRLVDEELRFAAQHRSRFMWPWETEPKSLAAAILDDETHDWWGVVRGMFTTGGYPVVVSEDLLEKAHTMARRATGISVCPTGSAGLAGCLDLWREGELPSRERIGLLFTGVER
jgi:threonine synthase